MPCCSTVAQPWSDGDDVIARNTGDSSCTLHLGSSGNKESIGWHPVIYRGVQERDEEQDMKCTERGKGRIGLLYNRGDRWPSSKS